jgi:hypothetical protein
VPKPSRLDVKRSPTSLRSAVADSSRCHAQYVNAANVAGGGDEDTSRSSDAWPADGGAPTKAPNVKRAVEP